MAMTISRLLQSTNKVDGYKPSDTFGHKKFGDIYAYNKTVRVKPKHSIIEVTMMITAVTEHIHSKTSAERPMAAHKVMVAISGVEQEILTAEELIARMRATYPECSDPEAVPDADVLQRALDPEKKPFKDKTVMEQTNGTYVLVTDKIKDSSLIQVWCSCSSYYWVFQYYNIQEDANIKLPGAPVRMPMYRYKTKKGFNSFKKGKPIRNPKKAPGVCKHLMLLLAMLMSSGVVAAKSKNAENVETAYFLNLSKFKSKTKTRVSKEEYDKLMKDFNADRRVQINERKYESASGPQSGSQGWFKSYNGNIARRMR